MIDPVDNTFARMDVYADDKHVCSAPIRPASQPMKWPINSIAKRVHFTVKLESSDHLTQVAREQLGLLRNPTITIAMLCRYEKP